MTRAGLQEGGSRSAKTGAWLRELVGSPWASWEGCHVIRDGGPRAVTQVEPTGGGDCWARGVEDSGRLWVAKPGYTAG